MNSCACAMRAARRPPRRSRPARRRRCSRAPSPRRGTDPGRRRRSTSAASRASRRERRRRRSPARPPVHVVEARHERRRAWSFPSRCGRSARSSRPGVTCRSIAVAARCGRRVGVLERDLLEADEPPAPAGSGAACGASSDLLGLVHDLEDALARCGRALRLADPHAEHAQRHDEHQRCSTLRRSRRRVSVPGGDHAPADQQHGGLRDGSAGTRAAARRSPAGGWPRTLCSKTRAPSE